MLKRVQTMVDDETLNKLDKMVKPGVSRSLLIRKAIQELVKKSKG